MQDQRWPQGCTRLQQSLPFALVEWARMLRMLQSCLSRLSPTGEKHIDLTMLSLFYKPASCHNEVDLIEVALDGRITAKNWKDAAGELIFHHLVCFRLCIVVVTTGEGSDGVLPRARRLAGCHNKRRPRA